MWWHISSCIFCWVAPFFQWESYTNSFSSYFFLPDEVFSLFPDQLAYLPKTSWHLIPSQHGTVPLKWGYSLDVSFWNVNINAQKRWTISITDGQGGIRQKLVTGLITVHKYIRHNDTLPWSTGTAIPKLCFHKHLQFPHQSTFMINILRLVFLLMASTWCQAQAKRKTTCKEWKSWRKCRRHSGWMLQQWAMYT